MTQTVAPGDQAGLLGIARGTRHVSAHNPMDKQSSVLKEEHHFSRGNFIQVRAADRN